jgi:hypothetical protein
LKKSALNFEKRFAGKHLKKWLPAIFLCSAGVCGKCSRVEVSCLIAGSMNPRAINLLLLSSRFRRLFLTKSPFRCRFTRRGRVSAYISCGPYCIWGQIKKSVIFCNFGLK